MIGRRLAHACLRAAHRMEYTAARAARDGCCESFRIFMMELSAFVVAMLQVTAMLNPLPLGSQVGIGPEVFRPLAVVLATIDEEWRPSLRPQVRVVYAPPSPPPLEDVDENGAVQGAQSQSDSGDTTETDEEPPIGPPSRVRVNIRRPQPVRIFIDLTN